MIEKHEYFDVFVRTWWRDTPRGLVPGAGRKVYLRRKVTEAEAKQLCWEWNSTHEPGKLSRKAEYTSR